LSAIPIIVLTALAMPGDKARCMAAGANGYITKPVSLKSLVKAIETQFSHQA
jgi:CheY-like chemotaxis protein